MLTNKAKYALRAMRHLALEYGNGPISITTISGACNIPKRFLENILIELRRAELVESSRGKAGGYTLSRAPQTITYADVIREIDGPLAWAGCASKRFYKRCEDCPDEQTCIIRPVLIQLRDATADILESVHLDAPLHS